MGNSIVSNEEATLRAEIYRLAQEWENASHKAFDEVSATENKDRKAALFEKALTCASHAVALYKIL